MTKLLKLSGQAAAYLAFAAFVAWFAASPAYHYADAEMASVKLSLSHAAERVEPCVQLTPEQIAEFAANMRRTEACERERLPLILEMDVDGETAISLVAQPSGLWNDGPASIYERFEIEPGTHRISVRLRDTARNEGWDYELTEDVVLEPGRYFSVTFQQATGGFKFR
ncbi:MAG: hypothetical protein ACR2QR_05555 [Woeseiaceae bacterium]